MFLQLTDEELTDVLRVYVEEKLSSYKQEYVVIGYEKSDTENMFCIHLEAKREEK